VAVWNEAPDLQVANKLCVVVEALKGGWWYAKGGVLLQDRMWKEQGLDIGWEEHNHIPQRVACNIWALPENA